MKPEMHTKHKGDELQSHTTNSTVVNMSQHMLRALHECITICPSTGKMKYKSNYPATKFKAHQRIHVSKVLLTFETVSAFHERSSLISSNVVQTARKSSLKVMRAV